MKRLFTLLFTVAAIITLPACWWDCNSCKSDKNTVVSSEEKTAEEQDLPSTEEAVEELHEHDHTHEIELSEEDIK